MTLRELENVIKLLCLADDSLQATEQSKQIRTARNSIGFACEILKTEKKERFNL